VGVGLAVAVDVADGVAVELFTVTTAVAMPTVPPALLYPLQTNVCVPFPTLVEGQAYVNVNPLELGYEGEVAV
jgi:hypothetical protein